jgi:hypothetical protein
MTQTRYFCLSSSVQMGMWTASWDAVLKVHIRPLVFLLFILFYLLVKLLTCKPAYVYFHPLDTFTKYMRTGCRHVSYGSIRILQISFLTHYPYGWPDAFINIFSVLTWWMNWTFKILHETLATFARCIPSTVPCFSHVSSQQVFLSIS